MWGRCNTCVAKDAEIQWLREQIAAERTERREVLDRHLATVNPQSLAAIRAMREGETPPMTWASDEHGTTLMGPRGEMEVERNAQGEECVRLDGNVIPIRELDKWMRRAADESAGVVSEQ